MNNALRKKRKAAGLCGDCGKPPAPGLKTCRKCLDRHQRSQKPRAFIDYHTRKESGICVDNGCNGEPVPGRVRCAYHMELADERQARVRAKRKAKRIKIAEAA